MGTHKLYSVCLLDGSSWHRWHVPYMTRRRIVRVDLVRRILGKKILISRRSLSKKSRRVDSCAAITIFGIALKRSCHSC